MFFRRALNVTASLFVLSQLAYCAPAQTPKPKLVVGIIIDQFRYDYLTRFRADYHGGLHQFLTQGADFTNAFYQQVPTVTAVGHSIFMSGAMPAVSGIVSNSWYDRDAGKVVTSVCDWDEKQVGGGHGDAEGAKCTDADPASPKRLLVSTLGDELRTADAKSKVIGVSIKARGAILPSGHRAAGAYWFDDETGNFITSTYYAKELPGWASAFNSQKLPAQYVDRKWEGFPKWSFHASAGSKLPYSSIPASPWGNELIEGFAEAALTGEQLGQRGVTDLLTVSFSSNDYVGHRAGPDSPEVRDMAIRTDQLLAKLFKRIDETVGMNNTVVVLSADHGVAPTPKQDTEDKMPGGYLHPDLEEVITGALNRKFGKAAWLVPGAGEMALYFNYEAFKSAKREEVFSVAREAILAAPQLHVARVYSREQMDNGVGGDFIARAEINGYFPRRSGDLFLVFEPDYIPGSSGTSHFSPYAYDRHVPVLFMGPNIKPGRYHETVAPNDIAPTLATMLNLQTPSGSSGRVLNEMFVTQ
jgi:predicted AlkP superfamily pyrophosphatase or phosphodiesterase